MSYSQSHVGTCRGACTVDRVLNILPHYKTIIKLKEIEIEMERHTIHDMEKYWTAGILRMMQSHHTFKYLNIIFSVIKFILKLSKLA